MRGKRGVAVAIETLKLSELIEKTGNIYEAIVIMAKRARAVNLVRMAEREEIEEEEDEEEEEVIATPTVRREDEPPKPTTLALEEMLAGDLEYRYPDVTDELLESPTDKENGDV